MAVLLSRYPGNKPGPQIIDPILSTKAAQEERGRQEINANDTDRVIESGTIIGAEFKRPGSMVRVTDDGEGFNAKLTHFAFTITGDPYSLTSSIQMERIK